MDGLRTPKKRRRRRTSTSVEEAPRKRLHLDLESEEVATSPEIAQEQATEVNGNLFEKPDTQQELVASSNEPRKDHPSIEQSSMNSQKHNMAEQNSWIGNNTQPSHSAHQTDISSAMINYAYMMATNWADPGLHMRIQSLPVLENLV